MDEWIVTSTQVWDVIIRPYHNFDRGLAKPPLHLGQEREFTSNRK